MGNQPFVAFNFEIDPQSFQYDFQIPSETLEASRTYEKIQEFFTKTPMRSLIKSPFRLYRYRRVSSGVVTELVSKDEKNPAPGKYFVDLKKLRFVSDKPGETLKDVEAMIQRSPIGSLIEFTAERNGRRSDTLLSKIYCWHPRLEETIICEGDEKLTTPAYFIKPLPTVDQLDLEDLDFTPTAF